jgi:hypothetical protein
MKDHSSRFVAGTHVAGLLLAAGAIVSTGLGVSACSASSTAPCDINVGARPIPNVGIPTITVTDAATGAPICDAMITVTQAGGQYASGPPIFRAASPEAGTISDDGGEGPQTLRYTATDSTDGYPCGYHVVDTYALGLSELRALVTKKGFQPVVVENIVTTTGAYVGCAAGPAPPAGNVNVVLVPES